LPVQYDLVKPPRKYLLSPALVPLNAIDDLIVDSGGKGTKVLLVSVLFPFVYTASLDHPFY
jgi:hypothetical protein